MRILFLPEVEDYLFELIELLCQKEYFGFKESALSYIADLEHDIRSNLPNKIKKKATPYFERFGKKMLYSVFERNKATSWYVFFNVYQEQDGKVVL
jgi:hypothetical protein